MSGFRRIFTTKSPVEQLLTGFFFVLAGFVLVPVFASIITQFVMWSNGVWAHQAWHQTGVAMMQHFFAGGGIFIAVVGGGRLLVYLAVKAGLLRDPRA